jgi:hypothetical protein
MTIAELLASEWGVWAVWGAVTLLYGSLLTRTLRANTGLPVRSPSVMLLVFLFFLNWYLAGETLKLWLDLEWSDETASPEFTAALSFAIALFQRLLLMTALTVVFRVPGHRAFWAILGADRRLTQILFSLLGLGWAGWTLSVGF